MSGPRAVAAENGRQGAEDDRPVDAPGPGAAGVADPPRDASAAEPGATQATSPEPVTSAPGTGKHGTSKHGTPETAAPGTEAAAPATGPATGPAVKPADGPSAEAVARAAAPDPQGAHGAAPVPLRKGTPQGLKPGAAALPGGAAQPAKGPDGGANSAAHQEDIAAGSAAKPDPGTPGPGKSGPGKPGPGKSGQGKPGQGQGRPGKAGKGPAATGPAGRAPGGTAQANKPPAGTAQAGKGSAGGPRPQAIAAAPPSRPVPPPAPAATVKPRHGLVLALFLVIVVLPVSVAAWYLYTRATDQYASTLGFSVRKEEGPSASELLGGIAALSGASSSDTDVLNEFIQSQDMVERVDAAFDLRAIYSFPERDPVFTIAPDATIEDLVEYWNRMVTIRYDGGVGLIEVRVLAFRPADAQAIAQAIFDESTRMINDLTAIARADATRYAREELEAAEERLRLARTELTEFRTRTQIVDPNADIQGQMGLLNTLQAQLAESLIELDLLGQTTREGDPRIRQTEQRIAVIENRIAEERAKFGISGATRSGQDYASLVGDYESLIVNREFAESAYLTALTSFDAAQAEAQRQTRYLAAHVRPTLAQSAEYPRRATILGVFALFAAMAWATLALIYYSVRDRR